MRNNPSDSKNSISFPDRNFAVAASMFMNSNSLPIALMQSLVATVPTLKWDDDDSKDAMLGRALSYLVLYSTLGMVLRWSYGVHILSKADPEGTEMERSQQDDTERYADEPREGILIDVEDADPLTMTGSPSMYSTHIDSPASHTQELSAKNGHIDPRAFGSFPNVASNSAVNLSAVSSTTTLQNHQTDSDDSDDDEPLQMSNHREMNSSTKKRSRRIWRRIKKAFKAFNSFMTAPLWAAFLSLIVALVPPLQHTLDVHLQPIKGALNAAGACSIPLTLVVLGAYFYTPSEKSDDTKPGNAPSERRGVQGGVADGTAHSSREPSQASTIRLYAAESIRSALRLVRFDKSKPKNASEVHHGEARTVFIAVVSRMFITPLVILPLMAIAAKFDNPNIFDE